MMQSLVICLIKILKELLKKVLSLPGMQYEEIIYEGYGPGGVAHNY